MMEWLGMACVTWTTFELLRIGAAAIESRRPLGVSAPASRSTAGFGSRSKPRAPRRFAAWDERGQPIHVEELDRDR